MPNATDAPEKIQLSFEEAESLKTRLQSNDLSEKDRKLLLGLISFNLWLQERLSRAM